MFVAGGETRLGFYGVFRCPNDAFGRVKVTREVGNAIEIVFIDFGDIFLTTRDRIWSPVKWLTQPAKGINFRLFEEMCMPHLKWKSLILDK